MEHQNIEKKELTKKFLALEDTYLEIVEKYGPLLVEKDTLEIDVEALRSNVDELTIEIDCQLFLGFEIMCDVVRTIALDFDFKKLNDIAATETMRQA